MGLTYDIRASTTEPMKPNLNRIPTSRYWLHTPCSMMDDWINGRGVTLIGADLDESPMAYRRLDEVLAFHAASARAVHRLRPFVVVMAGSGEVDPFKD